MDRLETRELAYFVAVAEELHVGRAARRLGIAQPPLSRAIRLLERRLGVELFERTARGVLLTDAGDVLLNDARRVLAAADAAIARVRRAGATDPGLTLVFKPGSDGGLLPTILARYDRVPVAIRTCGFGQSADLVRSGAADVALLHGKRQDLSGLDTAELLWENQVVLLPLGHRLAERPAVGLADLETDPTPLASPDELRIGVDASELLQLIALGRGMAVVPESGRAQLRRDLVAVPVLDADPTPVVLAWPEGHRSAALAAFVRVAIEVADQRVENSCIS